MTYSEAQIDIEKEKKKNIKLAIGVAALGIFGSFFLYVFLFALLFLKPDVMFGFIPFPEMLSKKFVVMNDKLYVIYTTMDFGELFFADEKLPEEKVQIGLLDGDKIALLDAIEPYASLTHDRASIYFISPGRYNTFDGKTLAETETNVIGTRPKGAISPEGLWVLSIIEDRPVLNLIKDTEVISFPLPEQFPPDQDYGYPCSTRLLWFQGNLYLYWTSGGKFYWGILDGTQWSVIESPGYTGLTKAIADDHRIYLFNRKYHQHHHSLSFATFEDGIWSEPVDVTIPGFVIEWSPLIYKDKLLLSTRNFFSEEMYTIEEGRAVDPVRIGGPIFGTGFISRILLLIFLGYVLYGLSVFVISVFIGKLKMKRWRINSAEFEFASLFRRFIAKFIDSFVIMLPPLLLLLYFLIHIEDVSDMFRLLILSFISAGYFLVVPFLYHSLLEGLCGTTIGKRIYGIRVLKEDFTECGLLAGFLRNLLRIVDYFFYYLVAVVIMAATLKWQRLGDVVAGTVVVRKRKKSG